ncbi:MAG TPA: VanW family protein [Clostridiaceae bacterium]|nr:VanW family protein [Clostridiaceae bacterium]
MKKHYLGFFRKNLIPLSFFALVFFVTGALLTACSPQERRVKRNVYLEDQNVGGMTESEAREIINEYAAKIDSDTGEFMTYDNALQVRQSAGKKVNVEKTLELLLNANEGERIKLVVENVNPPATPGTMQEITPPKTEHETTKRTTRRKLVEIASYTTKLLNRSENRVNNIELASNKLDNLVIEPGEEFSFNKVVGRRTKAKGYEEAPIIVQTEEGPKESIGIGGGICQVSTTLYNAVEEAGLKVTERHMHSKDIGYVPEGEDATVAYGTADFKFVNTRDNPIIIRTYLSKNKLTVKLFEDRS